MPVTPEVIIATSQLHLQVCPGCKLPGIPASQLTPGKVITIVRVNDDATVQITLPGARRQYTLPASAINVRNFKLVR